MYWFLIAAPLYLFLGIGVGKSVAVKVPAVIKQRVPSRIMNTHNQQREDPSITADAEKVDKSTGMFDAYVKLDMMNMNMEDDSVSDVEEHVCTMCLEQFEDEETLIDHLAIKCGTARIHEFEQGLGWKVQLKFTSLNKD